MAEMQIMVKLERSDEKRTLVGLQVLNEDTGEVVGEIIGDQVVDEDYMEATVKIAAGKLGETLKMAKGEIPFRLGGFDTEESLQG